MVLEVFVAVGMLNETTVKPIKIIKKKKYTNLRFWSYVVSYLQILLSF